MRLSACVSKYQWIFTKPGICIDIVGIYFRITYWQILSIFYIVISLPHDSGGDIVVSRFYFSFDLDNKSKNCGAAKQYFACANHAWWGTGLILTFPTWHCKYHVLQVGILYSKNMVPIRSYLGLFAHFWLNKLPNTIYWKSQISILGMPGCIYIS